MRYRLPPKTKIGDTKLVTRFWLCLYVACTREWLFLETATIRYEYTWEGKINYWEAFEVVDEVQTP